MKKIAKKLLLLAITSTLVATTNIAFANNTTVTAIALGTINLLNDLNALFYNSNQAFNNFVSLIIPIDSAQADSIQSQTLGLQSAQNTNALSFITITPPNEDQNNKANIVTGNFSSGAYAAMIPTERSQSAYKAMAYLSSGSLLSTDKFESKSQQAGAATFIKYLANMGNPIVPVNATLLNSASPTQRNSYLNDLANYTAVRSVAIDALYRQFNERVPLPSLNGESLLSNSEKSVLAHTSPAWHVMVSNMNIAELLRESVYQQALSNMQMLEMRKQLDQMNTLLATSVLMQSEAGSKTKLQTNINMLERAANQNIQSSSSNN